MHLGFMYVLLVTCKVGINDDGFKGLARVSGHCTKAGVGPCPSAALGAAGSWVGLAVRVRLTMMAKLHPSSSR